jgi:hypothetical protein
METELSSQMINRELSPEVSKQLALVREHLVQLGQRELDELVKESSNEPATTGC